MLYEVKLELNGGALSEGFYQHAVSERFELPNEGEENYNLESLRETVESLSSRYSAMYSVKILSIHEVHEKLVPLPLSQFVKVVR